MNPGGGRTPDKPDITLTAPEPGDPISSFLNVRVADIAAFYSDAKSKGHNSLPNHLTARPRYGAIYAIPTDTSSRSARAPACSTAFLPTAPAQDR